MQQALRGAVGAGGRRSGHVRGVHHNGVASFGVVDADARARELAVESALDAGSLAIIGRLRAVAAARRALGSGSVVRRRRQAVRGERHSNEALFKRCQCIILFWTPFRLNFFFLIACEEPVDRSHAC